jgi:DNA adenine methylase
MSPQRLTPLRYPGGKGRLSFFFHRLFERNDLCDGVYVEPYAGGLRSSLPVNQ